jgi:hypothetical protein
MVMMFSLAPLLISETLRRAALRSNIAGLVAYLPRRYDGPGPLASVGGPVLCGLTGAGRSSSFVLRSRRAFER